MSFVPRNGIFKGLLARLYNECACSRYWWNKLGFPKPMNLREMLAPTDKSFTDLINLNWFVNMVLEAYSGRRRAAENGFRIDYCLALLEGLIPWIHDSLISLVN